VCAAPCEDACRRGSIDAPISIPVFFRLEVAELKQVVASLRRLRGIDWTGLDRHTGFRWEAIEHLKAPNGARVNSLRLSQKVRAVAYRDGNFLRLICLHPDHDSADER
jgi:hypothetical protein